VLGPTLSASVQPTFFFIKSKECEIAGFGGIHWSEPESIEARMAALMVAGSWLSRSSAVVSGALGGAGGWSGRERTWKRVPSKAMRSIPRSTRPTRSGQEEGEGVPLGGEPPARMP